MNAQARSTRMGWQPLNSLIQDIRAGFVEITRHGMAALGLAVAAVVIAMVVLAAPASADSIPSSAGREDHVSMGSISARKLAMSASDGGVVS